MSFIARTVILVLACLGLMACAGSTPTPDPSPVIDSGRSSRSSGVAYRDNLIRTMPPAPRVSLEGDPRLGNTKAVIGIVEFSDYQCLYCRDFHRQQFVRLMKEYIDTGLVQFIYKDLPLRMHPQAIPAALAAHCAGVQGRFWEMHDALFSNQGRLGQNLYPALARQLNLDEANFNACLASQVFEQGIKQDLGAARMLGITGTPTFLIGNIEGDMLIVVHQSRGAPGFEVFAQEIEKLRQPPATSPR